MNVRSPLFRFSPNISRRITDTARGNSAVSQASSFSVQRNSSSALESRYFSAQTQKVVCYEDLVRDTIKKMMAERDEGQYSKGIADEDLQGRFQHYQSVFKEAELCIADLKEATVDQLEEECMCATGAVNNAFVAYLDLLDDLRQASDDQLEAYHNARSENANNLKRLRQELADIMERGV